MPDEVDDRTDRVRPGSPTRKISPTGLALAGVAALIFVGGTLLSVLSANDDTPEAEIARPSLSALMEDATFVLRGEATSVLRLGEPRDAGVLADIAVEEVIVAPDGDVGPLEISVYDKGFRESWSEGQTMLMFLGEEDELPKGADFRILDRCVLDEGGLPCPYDLADIRTQATP